MPKCVLLDNHLNVDVEGKIGPCAIFKKHRYFDKKFRTYAQYKSSVEYKNLKKNMQEGWDPGCEKCKIDEQQTGNSFRKSFIDVFGNSQTLDFVDISLSNHCNFSCRMCNPTTSSKWIKLIQKQPELKKYFAKKEYQTLHLSPQDIFKDIDLSQIKRVKYLGGEPFVTPELYDLIDFLITNTASDDIDLILTSNCSFFPAKATRKLEDKFKTVTINLSIDGYQESCEYSRIGADWKIIDKVYKQYQRWAANCSNVWLKVHSTVNAYTVHDCKNLIDYINSNIMMPNPEGDYEFYNLHQPSYLATAVLPIDYKNEITDEINRTYLTESSAQWDKFCAFTKTTDQATGLHINEYVPRLAKYLNK